MKENNVVAEVEGVEIVDLGDAKDETRQPHPMQIVQDGPLTWGRPFFE